MTNSGYGNSGDGNSGNWNSGNWNSGYGNTGNRNSGNWNSGDGNSGYGNSGDGNSGYGNSGNWNSGSYNQSSNNSGHFNTIEAPKTWMFNQWIELPLSQIHVPYIHLPTTKETEDGEFVSVSYKEAWKVTWERFSEKDRQEFLDLPGFNSEVFEEITGIDLADEDTSCDVEITVNGKRYKLVEDD